MVVTTATIGTTGLALAWSVDTAPANSGDRTTGATTAALEIAREKSGIRAAPPVHRSNDASDRCAAHGRTCNRFPNHSDHGAGRRGWLGHRDCPGCVSGAGGRATRRCRAGRRGSGSRRRESRCCAGARAGSRPCRDASSSSSSSAASDRHDRCVGRRMSQTTVGIRPRDSPCHGVGCGDPRCPRL